MKLQLLCHSLTSGTENQFGDHLRYWDHLQARDHSRARTALRSCVEASFVNQHSTSISYIGFKTVLNASVKSVIIILFFN